MELGMTKEDIKERLLENNIEKTFQYTNIEIIREEIDKWKGGL